MSFECTSCGRHCAGSPPEGNERCDTCRAKPSGWSFYTETLQIMLEAWRERCWTLTENGWEYLDDAPRLLSSYEERVMGAKLVADGLRGPNTNALQAIFRRTVG